MDISIRKAMLAGAIAAVISAPAFAAESGQYGRSSEASGKTESGMPMRGQSATGDSMSRQKDMEHKSMGATARSQVKNNPIYSRSVENLEGTEILDVAGKEVGTIKSVVLEKNRYSAHAVVSTGGVMGIAARDVLVSLDELNTAGDKLQLNITQEQLESRQEYQAEQYVELEGDKSISGAITEFSAFETEEEAQDPTAAPKAPESSQ